MDKFKLQTIQLKESLNEPPSWNEFIKTINKAKSNSAGGLTGATYNMYKALPEEVLKDIYKHIETIWKDKVIPTFWKHRWLKPIPKGTPETYPLKLRPIMLVEVSRKIWVAIIIQRIQRHWNKHKIINPANHAYNEASNTDFAIIQMLNTFEVAKDQRGAIAMGSWDYEKAFDSPAKSILLLAWIRLGVPQDIANYIVNMDIG